MSVIQGNVSGQTVRWRSGSCDLRADDRYARLALRKADGSA
jgi:hypothetical protein